jgi:hypothetical protein
MARDPAPQSRRFTYAEAKALMPEVRRLTAAAQAAAEALQAELLARPDDAQLVERLEREVRGWAEGVAALGLEVKGLWLVDFDSGAGYYCWRWPEADLEFYHSYEEGFGGRVRIH